MEDLIEVLKNVKTLSVKEAISNDFLRLYPTHIYDREHPSIKARMKLLEKFVNLLSAKPRTIDNLKIGDEIIYDLYDSPYSSDPTRYIHKLESQIDISDFQEEVEDDKVKIIDIRPRELMDLWEAINGIDEYKYYLKSLNDKKDDK